MKLKPKGRKIYRYKTRFERIKGFLRDTRAVTLTVLGTGALVFVGYSIGAPIMDFLKEQNILVPISTLESKGEVSSETELPTEGSTQPMTPKHEKLCGFYLEKSALSTKQALDEALSAIPAGITHVIVPLKTEGGRLYYGTRLADAGMCGAVIAATPLETIYTTIVDRGFIPVASINTLEDSVYPQTYAESAYKIAGTTDKWLDQENGGKPCLSPFSELTLDYLSNLTDEIVHAGFRVILCDGLMYPEFTQEDIQKVDAPLTSEDKSAALAQLVKVMSEASEQAAFYVSVDADDLLMGRAGFLKSDEQLPITGVIVSVNADSLMQKQMIQDQLSDYSCVLQLEGEGNSNSVVIDGSYILRPSF